MIHLPKSPGVEALPSSVEMKCFDQKTMESGVPSSQLMEKAASAVAMRLKALFPKWDTRFIFLCGPGNNGGDALLAASKLSLAGYQNVIAILVSSDKYSEDLHRECDKYLETKKPFFLFGGGGEKQGLASEIDPEGLKGLIQSPCVLVDGLLGTGQRDAPRGAVKDLLEVISEIWPSGDGLGLFRVALDLPTGVNGDNGQVYEPHFESDFCIAIERIKRGCVQYPARSIVGEIFVESIGIDCSQGADFVLISQDTLPLMPDRAPDVHKGQVGRIFVIGGSADMPGAPLLCAYAALRCGSGLVTVTQLEKASAAYIAPEIILKRLEGDSGYLELFHLVAFKEEIIRATCVVLGPGLGREESARAFVRETVDVLSGLGKFVVLDADALNLLSDTRGLIEGFDLSSAVLTPHPGEAARLLNWPISRVQEDRYGAASELLKMSGAAAIVLKGASTIIYGAGGGLVNLSGNPYMATAGSGDVLSGVIASLIGQGLDPFDAAVLGVHVHSRAGDSAHALSGGPIVASDFISYLPTVIFDRNCVEINFS